MSSKIFYSISIFILLVLAKNLSADIAGAYIFKHPITEQQVTLLGDIHGALCSEQSDYICLSLQELAAKNPEIKIFYEGYRDISRYRNLENLNILRRLTYLFKEERPNFIDIENREFQIPLLMLDFMISHQGKDFDEELAPQKIFIDEVLEHYESSPLFECIYLFLKELSILFEQTEKHLLEWDDVRSKVYEKLRGMVLLADDIKKFYANYLGKKLEDLIMDENFLKRYFDFFNGVSLLGGVVHNSFPVIELNCLFQILKHKKNCIIFTGYAHTDAIANLLIDLGFEPLLKTGLKSSSGKEHSCLADFEAEYEEDDKFYSNLSLLKQKEQKDEYIKNCIKRFCFLDIEILKKIFAYNGLE